MESKPKLQFSRDCHTVFGVSFLRRTSLESIGRQMQMGFGGCWINNDEKRISGEVTVRKWNFGLLCQGLQ
jgi:hypothetical protein